jgi:pyruvate/2-oxoglutarate dehydrogenase complex dihydrolipoamide dehydrogenase (E3) component
MEARSLGASVVLVERGRMGGDYLNAGTVPSRALAAAAHHANAMRSAAPFGIAADEPKVNTRKVHDAVQRVIAALAPASAPGRLEALGVSVIKAEARFSDPRTLAAGDTSIKARRFIIATGARTLTPAIPGIDSVPFFTSETIFDNSRKLTHLVVLGGGSIGLEIAQSYARLGSRVTVVEAGVPLPDADPELAAVALGRMREEGVEILPSTEVLGIQARSQGIGVTVKTAGEERLLDVSHILVADIRVPNLEALDLDKAGIRRAKGDPARLEVTRTLRTSNRRVYAIGEAAGAVFGPRAARQGRLAARSAILGPAALGDAGIVPNVTFTDPEIAEVGLTEAAARARHGDGIRVLRGNFADGDRAGATRQAYGTAKLIVGRDGRLLGAGIAGDRAGELISLFTLALTLRLGIGDLRPLVAPSATLSEIVPRLVADYFRDSAVSPLTQRLVALLRYLP